MDRYEVRREVERAFAKGNKTELYKAMRAKELTSLIDVLWDYMGEADNGTVAQRELTEIKEKIQTMNNKSGQRTRCIKLLPERRALVQLGPLKEEVIVSPNVNISKLKPGTEVLIIGSNEGRVLAEIREPTLHDGRLSKVQRVLDDKRIIIEDGGYELILKLAHGITCKEGDEIRYDLGAQMVMEIITNQKDSAYELSDVPGTTFENVKGLEEEKKYLRERIIYPSVYKDKFEKYGIKPIKGALFHGPPGCGKAGSLDSDVLTPYGYVKMKDIKKGSIISTPDGYSAEVLEIFPQGKIDIYKVIFSDGTSTECSLDHLWCVKTIDDRREKKPWRVKALKDMLHNIRQGNKRNYSIPMINPVHFAEKSDLLIDPYYLGLLLGDGSIIGFNRKFAARFRKELIKIGIFGKRSWEKFIPKEYKYASVHNRISLLQGLMDSNGTVSKNGYKISFTSISLCLVNDVRFLAESLGAKVTQNERITKYKYLERVLNGRKSYRISISMPPHINPFKLSRKRDRVVPRTKYKPARYINKVEYVGKKEAQCILVNHPDHLYITNNFIVTHNTFIAGAIFNEMAALRAELGSTMKAKTTNKGFFIINGPELLNKWAGNTESGIRSIFENARNTAEELGFPAVIFWDEIESICGRRNNSDTYTPEKTVVPTLLAELQGLKTANDVILIGATNRPDLIDPALMRPGRLGDAIIEIPRPCGDAAKDILKQEFDRKYVPKSLELLIENGIENKLISHVYDNEKPLAFAKLSSGEMEPFMRQEMVSGALFSQVGEELVRQTCIAEINKTEAPTIEEAIEMIDKILLSQLGILDAGVKGGFKMDASNYVMDVSLNA